LELAVTNLLKFFAYFFDDRRSGGFFEATISGLVQVVARSATSHNANHHHNGPERHIHHTHYTYHTQQQHTHLTQHTTSHQFVSIARHQRFCVFVGGRADR
jgi:hypothetical protein